jgi:rhamnose ABC transporter rhamnose-binding protein
MRVAHRICLLVLASQLFATSACRREAPAPPGASRTTIGLMPKLVGIDYFNACQEGAEEAAAELGVELIYDGPITNDVAKQAEMLDTWITRRLDAICVAPNDPDALAPTLQKAMQRGVRVLTWDADSRPDSRHHFVNQASYEEIGETLIEVMAEGIGGRGQVAIITGSLTAANQNLWMEQMQRHRAEKYPDMEIVTIKPSEEDQQLAFQVAQDLIKAYPDLKGIFGITSVSLPGAAEAVRQSGYQGKVFVTGLATPNAMRQYIKDSTVKAFVLWNPVDLGYLTVHAAKKLIDDGTLPSEFPAGRLGTIRVRDQVILLGSPIVFRADNIDAFAF